MNLKPFFCYFGGKYRVARHYPKPYCRTIIEPFAGAAGYSVRYAHRKILLYDIDPLICGLWQYLISVSESEILSLPLDITNGVDSLKVCQEAKWLIGFWLNKGTSRPRKTPAAWMREGTSTYWGEAIKDRISLQVQYIRHWRVFNQSYESIENQKASWFIDPPYQTAGKSYKHSSVDYKHLSNWAFQREGQLIVCEQKGATWMKFKPFRTITATRGTSEEVIYSKDSI